MAYWIVRGEIEQLDLSAYKSAAFDLRSWLEKEIGHLYRTRCLECGSENAHVKYFLWIKRRTCHNCHKYIALSPGYLIARNTRHPKNVFVCASCGNLNETEDRNHPGNCQFCASPLLFTGPAKRNRCECPHCGIINTYPDPTSGPPQHQMFAIEYHCPHCKPKHKGRFFKKPDNEDLARYSETVSRWADIQPAFVPDDEIPRLEAYYPVAVAILDSGLTCSASLPCPAEMGASIHINGTGSSIIDTVFVCRSTGTVPRRWLPEGPEGVAALVEKDVRELRLGSVKPTRGDVRCILFGHLIRLAIWSLRTYWNMGQPTNERLAAVARWIDKFGGLRAGARFLHP